MGTVEKSVIPQGRSDTNVEKSVIPQGRSYTNIVTPESVGLDPSNWGTSTDINITLDEMSPEERLTLKGAAKKMGIPFTEYLGLIQEISGKGIKIGKTLSWNEGGTPSMDRQMSFFDDGGLKDEGGSVDPESGNLVPSGSNKNEVRDDIDAKLSEGEFIFPADVTRYIGLSKLMAMRQEAKRGLAEMEEMGQMGGPSKEDSLPFSSADIIVMSEDGQLGEFAEGGSVQSMKTLPADSPFYNSSKYQQWQSDGGMGTQDVYTSTDGYTFTSGTAGRMYDKWLEENAVSDTGDTPVLDNVERVTFKEVLGESMLTFKEYKDAEGNSVTIGFIGGVPLQPIPEGYTYYDPNNPEDHPSAGTGESTGENELVEISPPPDGDAAYDDEGNWIGSGSKAQIARDTINTSGMSDEEFAKHVATTQGKGRNLIQALVGIFNPVMGLVTYGAMAYNDRTLMGEMQNRLNQSNLSAEVRATIKDALAIATKRTNGKLTSSVLKAIDYVAKALKLDETTVKNIKTSVIDNAKNVDKVVASTNPNNLPPIADVIDAIQKAKVDDEKALTNRENSLAYTGSGNAQTYNKLGTDFGTLEATGKIPDVTVPSQPSTAYPDDGYPTLGSGTYRASVPARKAKTTKEALKDPNISLGEKKGLTKLDELEQLATKNRGQTQQIKELRSKYGIGVESVGSIGTQYSDWYSEFEKQAKITPDTVSLPPDLQRKESPKQFIDRIDAIVAAGDEGLNRGETLAFNKAKKTQDKDMYTQAKEYVDRMKTILDKESWMQDNQKSNLTPEADLMARGLKNANERALEQALANRETYTGSDSTRSFVPSNAIDEQPSTFAADKDFRGLDSTKDRQRSEEFQSGSRSVQAKEDMVSAYEGYNPYGTTSTNYTKQTADSFIDAPRTDSIVSKANQDWYAAHDKRQKDYADERALTNRETYTGSPRTYSDAFLGDLSTPAPVPSAGKYSYASTADFNPKKVLEDASTETIKYTMGYDPNAYTGSGMNDTIAEGGKVAGKTSVEGVVENPNKLGYVSRVTRNPGTSSASHHTVFADSSGNLYAKTWTGKTFGVVDNGKGNYSVSTSKYTGPANAQTRPASVLDVWGNKLGIGTGTGTTTTAPETQVDTVKAPDTKIATDIWSRIAKDAETVADKKKTEEVQTQIERENEWGDGSPTSGSTSYTAPGSTSAYSGNYNEPGRRGGPDSDFGGTDGAGEADGTPHSKGGLAGKKPKSKKKQYKKGGLATPKK